MNERLYLMTPSQENTWKEMAKSTYFLPELLKSNDKG